jgi:phage FluMu protein Com
MFDYVFLCATMRVSMCNDVLLRADTYDHVLLSAVMCDDL